MSKQSLVFTQSSPRHLAALEVRDTLVCLDLDEVYGAEMTKMSEGGKSFWSITFCRARYIDGVVRVYSDRFIQIKYTRAGKKTSQVCKSSLEAKRFLMEKFL